MDFDLQSSRPIWQQLSEQLSRRIVTGVYPPGSRFPTVRDLAAEAGVNPNTMQRAFAELEREGLVLTQRTSGRSVTSEAGLVEEAKRHLAAVAIQTFWVSMRRLGFQQSEALRMLSSSGKTEKGE